jgi:hypothetical protein
LLLQKEQNVTRISPANVESPDRARPKAAMRPSGLTIADRSKLRIGIDFDNTLVTYDRVFLARARHSKLLPARFCGNKQEVRDAIRLLPDGELAWQRLQGYVYGQGIGGAAIFPGVDRFLRRCLQAGHTVFIVSHKTEYANHDPARVNLREAALAWMDARGFFDPRKYAIRRANVFFEGTRAEKLARIASLRCTHFVDDLIEVLADPGFPPGIERVLFDAPAGGGLPGMTVCASWREITAALLPEPR